MRFRKTFVIETVAGENMLINTAAGKSDQAAAFGINEATAWLWNKVMDLDFDEDRLVALLTGEYEVGEEVARKDIRDFLRLCDSFGMIER